MNSDQLRLALDRMRRAASEANGFVSGIDKETFLDDGILQRAVAMSLLMTGELTARLIAEHPDFVSDHPDLPWTSLRSMRNSIMQSYIDNDFHGVWDTAKTVAPDLVDKIHAISHWRAEGE
jgi:uncharacterized protein with HEPN domain